MLSIFFWWLAWLTLWPENGGSSFLWTVSGLLLNYMLPAATRRLYSSLSLQWEPQPDQTLCCHGNILIAKGLFNSMERVKSNLFQCCLLCSTVLMLPVGTVKGSSRLDRVAVSYGSEDRRGMRGWRQTVFSFEPSGLRTPVLAKSKGISGKLKQTNSSRLQQEKAKIISKLHNV